MVRQNAPAVHDHPEFVTAKLAEVTENGVVHKCRRNDLRSILPINVLPKSNSTKLRLILDGSPLVPYALKRKFKLEQIWKEGRELFAGCTHGSLIDISNAFFHIEIAEESACFLGFEWRGKYYQFNNLPMGIHEAPFVFTEITKPVVRHWRSMGIRVLKYMDDFPSGAPSEQQQWLHARYMVEHLRSLGWLKRPSLSKNLWSVSTHWVHSSRFPTTSSIWQRTSCGRSSTSRPLSTQKRNARFVPCLASPCS
jgi:hypothetical protein